LILLVSLDIGFVFSFAKGEKMSQEVQDTGETEKHGEQITKILI
jgi:hypothetical protein